MKRASKRGASGRRAAGGKRRRRRAELRPGRMLVLMAAVLGSSIGVVFISHENREIHTELEAMRRQQDRLLAEHSRLLLERGALVAYQNVERVAALELNMQFPDEVEHIAP